MKITTGASVIITDPRSNTETVGTVKWVSPTHKSWTVVLADGFVAFDFAKGV